MLHRFALTAAAVLSALAVLSPARADTGSIPLLISEFRLRGPSGANDEFVEIHNASDQPFTVQAEDGSAGFAVAASDGVVRFTLPNGLQIPARGYVLGVNSVAYSTGVPGDFTFTADIADNAGIALFQTADTTKFSLETRLDAVGSTSEAKTLYKEGNGYPAITPFPIDYAWTRRTSEAANTHLDFAYQSFGGCLAPDARASQDTDDNMADFLFVDTNGTSAGGGQRLGAPGPQRLQSPVAGGGLTMPALMAPSVGVHEAPNFVRDFTSAPANNSYFGHVRIRRQFTNSGSEPITSLRFRIVDLNTFPSPSGFADLRPMTSANDTVTLPGGATATVLGTTLVQPPSQWNGGGFNSVMNATSISAAQPLLPGESAIVEFRLGLQQTGRFRFFIETEANEQPGYATWGVIGGTDGAPPAGWVDCANPPRPPTSTQLVASKSALKVGESVTLTATVTHDDGVPVGTVVFESAVGDVLGSATLDANGKASLTLSTLPAGSHLITASYEGSEHHAPSSATLSQPILVQKHVTATTLASSSVQVVAGESVTLTATVTGATGEVSFGADAEELGRSALVDGIATLSGVVLPVGLNAVTAVYAGTGVYEASASSVLHVRVLHITTLALQAEARVVNEGEAVVLQVTSSATAGSVLVHENDSLVGTLTLGEATEVSITDASPGEHTYVASFAGSDTHAPATTQPVTVLVNATTSLQLEAPESVLFGEDAFVTVTVSASNGPAAGTVTFVVDEGAPSTPVSLDESGKARFSTADIDTRGPHSVAAVYAPARGFAESSAAPVQVQVLASTTTQVSAQATVIEGESVTFTAQVQASAGDVSGRVAFRNGETVLGESTLDESGRATFTTAALAPGQHEVTAHFLGTSELLPSASEAVQVLVQVKPDGDGDGKTDGDGKGNADGDRAKPRSGCSTTTAGSIAASLLGLLALRRRRQSQA